jgi:putative ABC transport system permease protein
VTSAPAALAALRIARRDAWRHKARSALVVLMIALPVLGLTSADVLARTYQLSPTQKLDRQIGQADAALLILGGGRVEQGLTLDGGASVTSEPGQRVRPVTPGSAAYRALERKALAELPAGSRVIDEIAADGQVAASARLVSASLDSVNLADPMTRGTTQLRSGRFPSDTAGVVVTAPLAARLGLHVGSTVTVGGRGLTVTGLVVSPSALKELGVIGMPGSLPTKGGSYTQLVATHQPVTWAMVQRLNRLGVGVTSRYVVAHPPAVVPGVGAPTGKDPATIGLATVAVGLAVLEVVLLAGAAFAVGARRARRDLALVSATGGRPGDVRNVVLAGGLVLGAVGAIIGVVGGVATARGLIPVLNRFAHHAPGSFDVRPLELLAVVLLGIVTGLLASILPARSDRPARSGDDGPPDSRHRPVGCRGRCPGRGVRRAPAGAVHGHPRRRGRLRAGFRDVRSRVRRSRRPAGEMGAVVTTTGTARRRPPSRPQRTRGGGDHGRDRRQHRGVDVLRQPGPHRRGELPAAGANRPDAHPD